MKLYAAFVCAVMMLSLFAHAEPAPKEVIIVNSDGEPVPVIDSSSGGGGGSGPTHVEFRGFSMLPGVFGGDGLLAMREACGMFGVGARMCTTEEILESTTLVDQGPVTAWVRPSPISEAPPDADDHNASFIDASGVYFSEEFANCNGWSYPAAPFSPLRQALTVSGDFVFGVGSCGESRPVACCGTPVQVEPVEPLELVEPVDPSLEVNP